MAIAWPETCTQIFIATHHQSIMKLLKYVWGHTLILDAHLQPPMHTTSVPHPRVGVGMQCKVPKGSAKTAQGYKQSARPLIISFPWRLVWTTTTLVASSITKITTHFPSILSAEKSDDLQGIQYSEAAVAAAAFRRRRRKQNKPQTTNGWNVSAEPEIQEMRSAEAAGFCFLLLLAWTRSPSSFVSIVGDRWMWPGWHKLSHTGDFYIIAITPIYFACGVSDAKCQPLPSGLRPEDNRHTVAPLHACYRWNQLDALAAMFILEAGVDLHKDGQRRCSKC